MWLEESNIPRIKMQRKYLDRQTSFYFSPPVKFSP